MRTIITIIDIIVIILLLSRVNFLRTERIIFRKIFLP